MVSKMTSPRCHQEKKLHPLWVLVVKQLIPGILETILERAIGEKTCSL